MIAAQHVTKYFGNTLAVNEASFQIHPGEIVGFLGQNGAGKTTLMRLLTTYLTPTSGNVVIHGHDTTKNPAAVKRLLGYLPENPPLYDDLTVSEYLYFAAQLKEIPNRYIRGRVLQVLSECFLEDVHHKMIRVLSKGYKQRVGIAQAIINDPKILILDEPTNGLDPIQNLQVRNLIKKLEKDRTVIISTHILSEIEHLAKRVLMIQSGRVIVDQSLESLLQKFSGRLEDVFVRMHTQEAL
jgi:ABC-2 type transport system ATP-binding protein